MRWICTGKQGFPVRGKIRVIRDRVARVLKVLLDLLGRGIVETQIRSRECLVEYRHAHELRQRAPFTCVMRRGDRVTPTRKHDARYAPAEGLKKGQLAFIKGQVDHIAAQA